MRPASICAERVNLIALPDVTTLPACGMPVITVILVAGAAAAQTSSASMVVTSVVAISSATSPVMPTLAVHAPALVRSVARHGEQVYICHRVQKGDVLDRNVPTPPTWFTCHSFSFAAPSYLQLCRIKL
jgi:hypothetical protein